MVTKNAPGYYTVASTGHDTLGYSAHVSAYVRSRYLSIEPAGYLYGQHDHVAQYYFRAALVYRFEVVA